MCILIPILIQLFIKEKYKLLLVPICTCITAIFFSGYTIAFLIFIVGVLGILTSDKNGKLDWSRLTALFIALMIGFLFVKSAKDLVGFIEQGNEHLASRLYELVDFANGDLAATSDLASRFYFYQMSLKTFISRIIYGLGPFYFYGGTGIGNHSQIFDDLARYGVIVVCIYILYIIHFKAWIKKIRDYSNREFYLDVPYVLFCLLSFINPTLILPILGLVLFMILPSLYFLDNRGNKN